MPVEERFSRKDIVQGNRNRDVQGQSWGFFYQGSLTKEKTPKHHVDKKQLNGVFYFERSHTSWNNGRIMTFDQPPGLLVPSCGASAT